MKNVTRWTGRLMAMSLLALSVVWLGSCKEDEEFVPTETILEQISANSDLSGLVSELEAAGLASALSAPGDYTLFAPSNTALNQLLGLLGITDFSPIRSDIAQAVLSYHIVASKVLASDLTEGAMIQSLVPGQSYEIGANSVINPEATFPGQVVETLEDATNGRVHIINAVLIPPFIGDLLTDLLGTVAQPIMLGASFSTLADAIKKADEFAGENQLDSLLNILSDDTKTLTVFAPVNAVFVAAELTVESLTGQQWYFTIANHVVNGNYGPGGTQTAFEDFLTIDTYAGGTITVLTTSAPTNPGAGITSGVVLNSDCDLQTPEGQIALENAGASGNGTVHAFAGVLTLCQ